MLYILYYSLLLINIIFSFVRKKSIAAMLISWLFMFFLFFSNDASGHDHYLYKIGFEHPEENLSFEFLYNMLQEMVRSLGITDYNVFLAILYLICSLLLVSALTKFTIFLHPIISLCLIFVFPQWATAIRFFLAISIAFFSFQYLLKGRWVIYLILILCATTVHYSVFFLFFITPFFLNIKLTEENTKKKEKILTYISIILILFAILIYSFAEKAIYGMANSTLGLIIGNAAAAEMDNKVTAYFESKTRFGFIMYVIIYIANLYTSLKLRKILNKHPIISNRTSRIAYFGIVINKILTISIPLVVVNLVFGRLFAIGSIVNFLTMGAIVEEIRHFNKTDKFLLVRCIIFILLSWTIPSLLEINSISPNNTINEAYQYWGI